MRFENELSVGAKMVRPWFELLSTELIWSATFVFCNRRMNVVNWPAFSRMAVTLVGPGGAGAAAGDWAEVRVEEMKKRRRANVGDKCFISF